MPSDSMDFRKAAKLWEFNAGADAMWAILSDPARRGRKWRSDEFFASGRRQIESLWQKLSATGALPAGNSALDFGCGLGRLSEPLTEKFTEVVGVDVSRRMIEQAKRHSRTRQVRYVANPHPDLRLFPDDKFDFVLSLIVLQHVPPPTNRRYLAELVRVLAREGTMVLQVPSERLVTADRTSWKTLVKRVLPEVAWRPLRRLIAPRQPVLHMYGISRSEVEAILRSVADVEIASQRDDAAGPEWQSFTYFVRKRR